MKNITFCIKLIKYAQPVNVRHVVTGVGAGAAVGHDTVEAVVVLGEAGGGLGLGEGGVRANT